MARSKHPMLVGRSEVPRAEIRNPVSLAGRCQVGDEPARDVEVRNLDRRGCRMRGFAAAVTRGEPLLLWLGPVGPVTGRLRWAKRGATGVVFDDPLTEDEFERALSDARTAAAGANVLELVRRPA